MRALITFALAACILLPGQASASRSVGDQWDILAAPKPVAKSKVVKKRAVKHRNVVKVRAKKRAVMASASPTAPTISGYGEAIMRGSVSLAGVVPELASFARRVVSECGSKVISAMRHTRVRGSGQWSLHASGRAVDMAGNPSCIARHLADWRGGASNDYHRIRPNHFHISWGGREHGKRFAHYQGRKARKVRYAGVGR